MFALMLFVIHIYYICRAILWSWLWISSRNKNKEHYDIQNLTKFPKYTILCALYKEAEILPQLISNLQKIDYPKDKLQILIVLEEDDLATISAAISCNISPVIVPAPQHGETKTKPRALNYALQYVSGEFLVIYDAEDEPEVDQLKKAVVKFEENPDVVCLQAQLNYRNYKENWLARMFAMEYTFWFDRLIAGLASQDMPIPLGGTSNHIYVPTLRKLGGWDAKNVTEDCELGLRLYENNYKVSWLHSTTWEEACCRFWPWIKQRTRWSKGYMYTLMTVNHPKSVKGIISYHLFVLGTPLVALLNVILLPIFFYWLLGGNVEPLFPTKLTWAVAMISMVFGNAACIVMPAIAFYKRGRRREALLSLTLPVYWLMHSLAAYRALYQLVFDPYTWEKTEHNISKRDDRKKGAQNA